MQYLVTGVALIALTTGIADARMAPPQATAAQSGASAEAKAQPSQPWAQVASDVPVDANVRFGTLPNGMRYAIMKNATPPHQASLYLRIDAGSLMEKDNQRGLAHFMEHMAFNGTTHIPKNDLIAILGRLGLAFGADLNAATGFDQTFYQLHVPRTDDETVDSALHVLREQVSEATMDADDIVDERGVIAGEERLRNTPALRISQKQIDVLAQGQKVATRFPIGDLNIINTAPRERFADFYNSYYRPSRATLVAVGDFDVDVMEAKIRKAYGDWQPKAPDGPEPDLGTVARHGPETHVFVEPGIPSSIGLYWTKAPDLTPDTLAERRKAWLKWLGTAIFNRRLNELSNIDNAPFLQAQAGQTGLVRSVDIGAITALYVPGKWKRAIEAVDQELRRFLQYGVTDTELQREIVNYRGGMEGAAKGASTRQTRGLGDGLLNSVNGRYVITSPQTDLDLFERAIKGLTATEVSEAMKPLFAGSGPLTMVTSPVPIEGGEVAVAAALGDSHKVAVAAPIMLRTRPWPYTNFGKPGTVRERHELAGLGTTVVTFANGVMLTVKPTTFRKDSIGISMLTGLGEQNFSPDRHDPAQEMVGGLQVGGLGKLTVDEMDRSLNGHVIGASLSIQADRFLLSGSTQPKDLQLEMQVLAAYLTDPAYRSTPFDKNKMGYPASYEAALATPSGAFQVHAGGLLAGGDQRLAVVPPETYATWTIKAERARLKALLSKGPIHLTMVGDLTVDEAIAATARTFGALPRRPAAGPPVPGADQRHFPAPTPEPLRFTHKGLAEQSLGVIAWPATDTIRDKTEARRLEVLTAVLKLRVLEEIRERLALAYAPTVASNYSDTYKGFGIISVQAQTAPDKLPAFFTAMNGIIQKLRDEPISADELKRAREPQVEAARRSQNSNGWWLGNLTYAVDRPWYLPQTLTGIDEMEKMTPADVQALARQYLRPDTAWKAEVLPEQVQTK
jgi:zinc protease